MSVAEWVKEELSTSDLSDQRLNNRLENLVTALYAQPNKSIPQACNGWAETVAAYRFLDNSNVTMEKILAPHKEATIERIKQERVVLMPQDTTELNFSHREEMKGMGKLSRCFEQGFHVHPTIALTANGTCLGVINSEAWIRKSLGHTKDRYDKKIEEKESMRWINSYRICNEIAKQAPDTLIVNIGDREADIYELFAERDASKKEGAHWLIRACQDRKLVIENGKKTVASTVKKAVRKMPVIGNIKFLLPRRDNKKGRIVKQEVRSGQFILQPPRSQKKLEPIKVNAIFCTEIKGTKARGEKTVEWILLTSLPIDTEAQVLEIINWYLYRWQIEIFFMVLKVGCKIEALQLETYNRVANCLAMYMIIAWRIMFCTMLGRECPDVNCEIIFDKVEWQAAYVATTKKRPPNKPPTLREMIRMVAKLGGFLGRKNDGEPGVQSIWIGLQRVKDLALMMTLTKHLKYKG